MTRICIGAYPDLTSLERIEEYFSLASKYGVTDVFASVLSANKTNEEIIQQFSLFDQLAHKYHLEVTLDFNPHTLKKLSITPDDLSLLKEIGCDCLRLDQNYDLETDLKIINNPYGIKIGLNATSVSLDELDYLYQHGVKENQLSLGHNSYPQRYTGMKWETFKAINHQLKRYPYPVSAAVSSQEKNTIDYWGGKWGVPTVERLRNYPIDVAARILLYTNDVDGIFIGNAFASEEEFKNLSLVLQEPRDITKSILYQPFKDYGIVLPQSQKDKKLKIILDKEITEEEKYILFDLYPHSDAGDSSEWIYRSRTGRYLNKQIPVRPSKVTQFQPGDVLIFNSSFQHYAGEIQIAKLPVENDGTRNLIGHLAPHEEEILELIKDNEEVRFLEY